MAKERPNGLVPLVFRVAFGMDAYNGGTSGIMFSQAQPFNEVPPEVAERLIERWPDNFTIQERPKEKPAAEAGAPDAEQAAADEADGITYESLNMQHINRLRKVAAELSEEGETVPRKKDEIIRFILEHME